MKTKSILNFISVLVACCACSVAPVDVNETRSFDLYTPRECVKVEGHFWANSHFWLHKETPADMARFRSELYCGGQIVHVGPAESEGFYTFEEFEK